MITARLQNRFYLLQNMGGDNDGLLSGHLANERSHLELLVGVEAVRRLVQNQNVGIMYQRLGQTDTPFVALRQRVDRLIKHAFQVGELHRARNGRSAGRTRQAADIGDESEIGLRSHISICGGTFWEVTDVTLCLDRIL